MIEIIWSRTSVIVPAEAKTRRGYKWRRVIIICCLLFFVHQAGAVFFDSQTKSEPGDGACDLCGSYLRDPWDQSVSVGYVKNGKLMREYCEFHGTVYCILHPLVSVSLLKSTVGEAIQEDKNVALSLGVMGMPIFIPLRKRFAAIWNGSIKCALLNHKEI